MKTFSLRKEDVKKKWLLIDAKDAVLGRLAVHSANILRGKNKPNYTPNQDCGDNLIIINADHVLNLPDFRAHERSYQMLCQVAGRAGRSDNKGKVIIQTFQPHHPILKNVLEHDYEGL